MATHGSVGIGFLVRWTVQALVSGVSAAVLVRVGDITISTASGILPVWGIHPIIAAAIAALLSGLVLYRIAPGAAGEGIPAYLDAIRDRDATLPLKETVVKYPAALLALSLWGSGGAVGPLGRVNSGLSQSATLLFQRLFPRLFADNESHEAHYHAPTTAAISGMAAAVAAIFHAPIAGAVFAVEIIQTDQMRYHQLFPAALASTFAVFFMEVLDWPSPVQTVVTAYAPEAFAIIPIIVVGLFSGTIGRFYTALYRTMAHRMGRYHRTHRTRRLVLGMVAAASIAFFVQPIIAGTSSRLPLIVGIGDLDSLAIQWLPIGGALLISVIMIAKILTNCLTVASGMSAGFTGPAALVGMLAGASIALLFGYDPGSHGYTSLVVAGFAGTLASTMNIPLAASILAMEVFAPAFGVPAGIAAILGFQTARYNTIYDAALENRREGDLTDR